MKNSKLSKQCLQFEKAHVKVSKNEKSSHLKVDVQ